MASYLKTSCPSCQKVLRIKTELLGSRIRCPACNHRWTLATVAFPSGQSLDESPEALQTREETSIDASPGEPKRPSSDVEEPSLGTIARFELREALGGGGFGVVYRAYDPTLGRMVAIKVPKFLSDDTRKSQRFLTEAHAAANLHHPNIVAVFESGQAGDKLYIVSEYVEGEPLSKRISAKQPSFREAAEWVGALADALGYAHREGIVHRDIKPDNIMMGAEDRPLLMDFGLAKLTKEDSQVTGDGSILGTPAYMSPEQARGETEQVGPQSDQYSLGVVLYELLTGQRPFNGPPHKVIAEVAADDPPEPRSINPDIPRDLAAICQKAIEKEADHRYVDMSHMADDLARWREGRETAARPLSLLEKGRRWYRKNPTVARLWLSVATLISIILLLGIIDYVRTKYVVVRQIAQVDTAETARIDSQRALAINEFERGRRLCEEGQLNQGLLWLTKSLESLTPEMQDLERPIRGYIGSWMPHIHSLQHILVHDRPALAVAITPDGQTLLTTSGDISGGSSPVPRPGKTGNGSIHRWDLSTGRELGKAIEHDQLVTSLAVSPDGQFAVSGCLDHKLRVFDPKTGEPLREPIEHPRGITAVAFNAEGTLLATACLDENVRIWNTNTWEQIGPALNQSEQDLELKKALPKPVQPYVQRMAFSDDDGTLFVFALRTSYTFPVFYSPVRIWNLETATQVESPKAFSDLGYRLTDFTPDGRQLIFENQDDNRIVFDWGNDRLEDVVLIEETDRIRGLCNNRSARLLITAQDQSAWVFDSDLGKKHGQSLLHDESVNFVATTPDGKTFVTSSFDRHVKVWKTAEERRWGTPLPHFHGVQTQFLPDGKSFCTIDLTKPPVERYWDTDTLQETQGPYKSVSDIPRLAFSSDGRIAARAGGQSLTLYEIHNGNVIGNPMDVPGAIGGVFFLEDDSVLVTASGDRHLRFWDVETQQLMGDPVATHGRIMSMSLSADETMISVAHNDGHVQIWDVAGRAPLSDLIPHRKTVWGTGFHPTGEMLASTCDDGSVYFWTVPDGKPSGTPITNLDIHINGVKFHPDGERVLVESGRYGAIFWDIDTRLPASRQLTHGEWLLGADLNPAGDKLLTWGIEVKNVRRPIFRNLAPALEGSPHQIRLLVETMLGTQIEESGQLGVLIADEWEERRSQLSASP